MSGLKGVENALQVNSNKKVSPDEIDRYEQYIIKHPSISPTYFGTVAGTASQNQAIVFDNVAADYPRNVVVGLAGSNTLGGTVTVNGKNQFGVSISETITVADAANGGTVAGTKVFAKVTSGTSSFTSTTVGSGTARLGVAIGTSATAAHIFGLPTKIASTTDVKLLTWINQGTATALTGGTIGAYVNTTQHGFRGTAIVAITDEYMVLFKTTYDAQSEGDQTGL